MPPREPMPTPVEPFIQNALPYDHPDYVRGAVMRIEAQIGRKPRSLGEDDEGAGLLRDMTLVKQRLGRMPGTHGVDDPGEGVLLHVFEDRRKNKRLNWGALVSAAAALLLAAATLLRAEARAIGGEPPPHSAPAAK